MNKIYSLVISFMFLSSMSIQAQDTLKAVQNSWSTELNFNPFNGSLSLNNAYAQIKARNFYSRDMAFRVDITINYNQNINNVESTYGVNPTKDNDNRHSFMIAINAGQEKHFHGSNRLSPYIGYEVGLGIKTTKEEIETDTYTRTIDGAWENVQTYSSGQYYYSTTNYDERGFWSLGGNLITGFDFYMAKNFYFGYELSFGVAYIKYANIDITQDNTNNNQNNNNTYPKYDTKAWTIGPKLMNGIRIGYIF